MKNKFELIKIPNSACFFSYIAPLITNGLYWEMKADIHFLVHRDIVIATRETRRIESKMYE